MPALIQCVPNFSEGRDAHVMRQIVDAAGSIPGARVADWSADPDHHRMVLTLVGPSETVAQACAAACAAAIECIDLRKHAGVHPRLGAVDVVPFVPLSGFMLADCAALSVQFAQELAERHSLPVFLYEAAADKRPLPFVRKEAFHSLVPDFGPHTPHPTAGATVVGARLPLVAYNINLAGDDLRAAKRIARELREGGGAGFHGVRALGLSLPSRGTAQVSMNVTFPALTPLLSVFEYVVRRAEELGSVVTDSEVIGALPASAALSVLSDALRVPVTPGQILWEGMDEENGE